MSTEDLLNLLLHVPGNTVGRGSIKRFIQDWARQTTWEEVQPLIAEGRSWADIPADSREKLYNLFSHLPGLVESITFEDVVAWLEKANPKLLARVFSSPQGAIWFRKGYDDFRKALLRDEEVVLVKIKKAS